MEYQYKSCFAEVIADFVKAVEEDRDPIASGLDGMHVSPVRDEAAVVEEEGRLVEGAIPDPLPRAAEIGDGGALEQPLEIERGVEADLVQRPPEAQRRCERGERPQAAETGGAADHEHFAEMGVARHRLRRRRPHRPGDVGRGEAPSERARHRQRLDDVADGAELHDQDSPALFAHGVGAARSSGGRAFHLL